MTKVLIIGANGKLTRDTTRMFLRDTEARLTLYLRKSRGLTNPDQMRVTIIEGDVLDQSRSRKRREGRTLSTRISLGS